MKPRRENPVPPYHLGITGSMGMGKSATAKMFNALGFPLYDADAEVHALYQPGGAGVAPVAEIFPQARSKHGGIDRALLRQACAQNPHAVQQLEAVVHPLMAQNRLDFLARHQAAPALVFDIPLLFETGGEKGMDYVIVASAPEKTQHERILARGTLDEAMLKQLLARQMSDAEKRELADFIVNTGEGFDKARAEVAAISKKLRLL